MYTLEKNNSINISIIIPVYNDPLGLENCLKALTLQTAHLSETEIIVIDNASSISLENITNEFPFAKYAYEKKAGSYAARNKGMSIAKGGHLVFLDADCTPEPDWLEKGIKALQNSGENALVGGSILFSLSEKPTTIELYQYIVGFQQEENIQYKQFSATANIFINRKNALKIGDFEDRLLSGGDRNWCWRALELEIPITYCPDAIVTTKPRRLLKNAIKQTRRVAGGRFQAQALNLTNTPIIKNRQKPHRTNWQSLLWIFQHPKLSYLQRVQVFSIAIFLKGVAVVERWRLTFGSKAERS